MTAGDPERTRFERAFEEQRERLLRFVTLLGAPDPEAVIQQSWAIAWQDRERFAARSKFGSWLFGIARNVARNEMRRSATPTQSPDRLQGVPAARGVLTSVVRRELAERLELAIGRLPRSFGEAFVLHHLEGLSFAEVAEIVDVSEATARVRAHRARGLLRAELGEDP